jgi:DegV family protein with EDD domain
MPPELAEEYGVEIVPLTVTVDAVPYLDGVELGADDFYARFEKGKEVVVATSQPSAGRFAEAYARLAEHGAREILSIHADGRVSGSVNAARLAAASAPVPVRVVETSTASFGVAGCTREAAVALRHGYTAGDAAEIAARVGRRTGNVFVVRALDLARAGGRLREGSEADEPGIPVLTLSEGAMTVVGHAADIEEAAETMAAHVLAGGRQLRVGVGLADRAVVPLRDALERRLRAAPEIGDLVRYRIGPSVGAHTGPGTVGAMFYPTQFSPPQFYP